MALFVFGTVTSEFVIESVHVTYIAECIRVGMNKHDQSLFFFKIESLEFLS